MSLKQRAEALNFRFGVEAFKPSSLREVYRRYGVRFKTVRLRKVPRPGARSRLTFERDCQQMRSSVEKWLGEGYEMLQLDECCFTWRGYTKNCWAPKGSNLELHRVNASDANCIACVGAISTTQGKELFSFRYKSFNAAQFLSFFKQLCRHMRGRRWFAFLDNCSIHKCKPLLNWARRCKVPLVFCVPYSPQFNGIELFWAQAKHIYRQMGTRNLLQQRHRDLEEEAKASVAVVAD